MDLQSALVGGLVVTVVFGVVILIRWVLKHTKVVAELKGDLDSLESSVERTHQYLDQKIGSVKMDVTEDIKNVHDRITEVHDDIKNQVTSVTEKVNTAVSDTTQVVKNAIDDATKVDKNITADVDKVVAKN